MESVDVRLDITTEKKSEKQSEKTRSSRLFRRSDKKSIEEVDGGRTVVQSREDAAKKERGLFPANAAEFVMALGFGLFFATLQVFFGNNLLIAQRLHSAFAASVMAPSVGFIAFCVTMVACWYYSDRIARVKQSRVCTISTATLVVFMVFRCVAEYLDVYILPLALFIEVVSGIMFAILFIVWVADLWVLQRRAAVRVMILSLCIAAGCAAIVATVSASVFRYLAMAVCLILSCFSFLAITQHVEAEEFLTRDETRRNIKFDMRTSISLFITAIAYGFCLNLVAGFGEINICIIAISFLLAAILAAISMVFLGDRGVLLGSIFRYMCPVLTAGLVSLPFASGHLLYVCTVIVLSVCFTCLISLLVTLVQVKIRFKVQPVYACARVLLPCAWGALLGLVVAIVEFELFAIAGNAVLVAISLAIVVLLSVSTAIAPYGIDMLTMPIEPDNIADGSEDDTRDLHAWKTACEQIAKENGLTPREIDVFTLLAKGRNAKVIERELFISVYTIKGHNNNIYRKLGVKSQQELIDLVESRRREIWELKTDID